MMRRVVVTGMGMVTPLGCGVETNWSRLIAAESGARKIDTFEVSDITCRIAGMIPYGDGTNGTYNPDQWMEPKEQRKVDKFIVYAMCAAKQALDHAGWHPKIPDDQNNTGVLIGDAIGDAGRMIALGDADVMVAGGTESPVNRISLAGFAAVRALTTSFNDTPTKASRPYDKDRDGFLMGEGAGCVVLEEYEHAKARGAKMYAELVGYGLSGDAFHITAPTSDGDGAFRCMKAAIKRAGIEPSDIDYINAHGTSTPLGDEIELGAVERVVGNAASRISMSSTKSSIGHLLGAAGAVEAIYCILAMRDGIAPPTLNLDNPSIETPIDLVPHQARKRDINVVLSNSFGF